jgi:hypothetical protein
MDRVEQTAVRWGFGDGTGTTAENVREGTTHRRDGMPSLVLTMHARNINRASTRPLCIDTNIIIPPVVAFARRSSLVCCKPISEECKIGQDSGAQSRQRSPFIPVAGRRK